LVSYLLSSSNKGLNIHSNRTIKYVMSALLCIIGISILIRSMHEYF
jgi:hypothetical protein